MEAWISRTEGQTTPGFRQRPLRVVIVSNSARRRIEAARTAFASLALASSATGCSEPSRYPGELEKFPTAITASSCRPIRRFLVVFGSPRLLRPLGTSEFPGPLITSLGPSSDRGLSLYPTPACGQCSVFTGPPRSIYYVEAGCRSGQPQTWALLAVYLLVVNAGYASATAARHGSRRAFPVLSRRVDRGAARAPDRSRPEGPRRPTRQIRILS